MIHRKSNVDLLIYIKVFCPQTHIDNITAVVLINSDELRTCIEQVHSILTNSYQEKERNLYFLQVKVLENEKSTVSV